MNKVGLSLKDIMNFFLRGSKLFLILGIISTLSFYALIKLSSKMPFDSKFALFTPPAFKSEFLLSINTEKNIYLNLNIDDKISIKELNLSEKYSFLNSNYIKHILTSDMFLLKIEEKFQERLHFALKKNKTYQKGEFLDFLRRNMHIKVNTRYYTDNNLSVEIYSPNSKLSYDIACEVQKNIIEKINLLLKNFDSLAELKSLIKTYKMSIIALEELPNEKNNLILTNKKEVLKHYTTALKLLKTKTDNEARNKLIVIYDASENKQIILPNTKMILLIQIFGIFFLVLCIIAIKDYVEIQREK